MSSKVAPEPHDSQRMSLDTALAQMSQPGPSSAGSAGPGGQPETKVEAVRVAPREEPGGEGTAGGGGGGEGEEGEEGGSGSGSSSDDEAEEEEEDSVPSLDEAPKRSRRGSMPMSMRDEKGRRGTMAKLIRLSSSVTRESETNPRNSMSLSPPASRDRDSERDSGNDYNKLREELLSKIAARVDDDNNEKMGGNLWKMAKAGAGAKKKDGTSVGKRLRSFGSMAKSALKQRTAARRAMEGVERDTLLSRAAEAISGLFDFLPIFLPNSSFKSLWNTVIIAVTFIIAITIPLQEGFGEEPSFVLQFFDVILDMLYMGDVAILFRSAIILDNKYIKDPKAIAKSYMQSTFFSVDIFAAVPVGVITIATGDGRPERLDTAITVVRLFKVLKIIKCIFVMGDSFRKTVNVRPSDYIRMAALVFYLLLVTHWIACIYAGMCREANFPVDFCEHESNIDHDDLAQWYTHNFLWGITSMTGIEIMSDPYSVGQNLFCIGVVIFGVFVYAAIIGNVNGIMSNQRFAETEFQRRVDSVVQYMNYRKVPEEHQKKVMMYYRILWARNRGVNEEHLLSDLSRSLRSDTLRMVNTSVVSKLSFLEDAAEDHINLFCERFISVFQLPGDIVSTYNTTIDYVYFITRGSVESMPPSGNASELKKGDSIGLDDMILGDKYTATSRTKTFCDLVQLPKEHMLELIYVLPQMRAKVEYILRRKKLSMQRKERKSEDGGVSPTSGSGGASAGAGASAGGAGASGNGESSESDNQLMDEFQKRHADEAFAKRNYMGFRETLFATVQDSDFEEEEKAELMRRRKSQEVRRKSSHLKRHSQFFGFVPKRISNLGMSKASVEEAREAPGTPQRDGGEEEEEAPKVAKLKTERTVSRGGGDRLREASLPPMDPVTESPHANEVVPVAASPSPASPARQNANDLEVVDADESGAQ